jgi:hypothetical protein
MATTAPTVPAVSSGTPKIHNRTLSLLTPVPADIDIAQNATILPITEVAKALKLQDDELHLYGKYKAKVSISVRDRMASKPNGKYVCVAGITPTPLGEGKSTTAVIISPWFFCSFSAIDGPFNHGLNSTYIPDDSVDCSKMVM